jgi:hypothetical protein
MHLSYQVISDITLLANIDPALPIENSTLYHRFAAECLVDFFLNQFQALQFKEGKQFLQLVLLVARRYAWKRK